MTDRHFPNGVGVALLTLFDTDGSLCAAETAEHALDIAQRDVDWFLALGTTGEGQCLTELERLQLLGRLRQVLGTEAPIYVGVRDDGILSALEQARQACEEGATGVIALAAASDVEGYYGRLRAVLHGEALIAYHLPGPWGGNVPMELLPRLDVDGVKDASGDGSRMLRTLACGGGPILVGLGLLAMARAAGAAGAALALANLAPELCAEVFYAPNPDNVAALARLAEQASGPFPLAMKRQLARHRPISATCRSTL